MTITFKIATSNAAFEEDRDEEVARIIRQAIRDHFRFAKAYDSNGNCVGTIMVRGQ